MNCIKAVNVVSLRDCDKLSTYFGNVNMDKIICVYNGHRDYLFEQIRRDMQRMRNENGNDVSNKGANNK